MDDHQADHDALASAVGAALHNTGSVDHHHHQAHHFHHQLQQPDFSQHHRSIHSQQHSSANSVGGGDEGHHQHNGDDDGEDDDDDNDALLNLGHMGHDDGEHGDDHGEGGMHGDDDLETVLGGMGTPTGDMDGAQRTSGFGRPPSIRKACDLCHAAKQKCSGDRPSCTRCSAGGWQCVYAPRQRRRTVPKEQKLAQASLEQQRAHSLAGLQQPTNKKRKLGGGRDSGSYGGEMDIKSGGLGMGIDSGMGMDFGLGEEEGEDMISMSDDQMLESIAIDGYLADLPLETFVRNLPFQPGQQQPEPAYTEDIQTGTDSQFPSAAEMDQHTTSALRDAIWSLNESSGGQGAGEGGEGEHGGEGQGEGGEGLDPHLALLDLSTMPGVEEGNAATGEGGDLNIPHFSSHQAPPQPQHACPHIPLVPHILALLTQHPLEPKPGSNTPLTLAVFAPLARSLRLFHGLTICPHCAASPAQTLPQLALLSRTTTILTFPFPPISGTMTSANLTISGARLIGTGLSEAIEQHIVGVVWDSWRAAVREVFATFERRAQEVIQNHSQRVASGEVEGGGSSAETQRAGLMFQAMSRLVTAMDEVEGQ